jgi:hypothetical protein
MKHVWGRGETCAVFWWGNLRERDHWGDPGIDGRMILRWIFRKLDVGGMDWIELAQGRVRWRALMNVVMNLQVPKNVGNFLTSCKFFVNFSRRTTLLHGISKWCNMSDELNVVTVG